MASARIWGKRHLFLLGCLILIASCAWGGATHSSKSYKSMLWARIFQGVATAPFEALTNACVGDLYFVHERGTRMALTNVALFGGAFLTPVLVGHISATMGWQWTFYFIAIFGGASFPLLFFFVPETAYRRAAHFNTDIELETFHPKPEERPSSGEGHSVASERNRLSQEKAVVGTTSPVSSQPARMSYMDTLSPFNGRKTDESFLKILIRPFPLFFHLAIVWACLIQGVIIGWTVFVGVVIAAVYLGPPLFFTGKCP